VAMDCTCKKTIQLPIPARWLAWVSSLCATSQGRISLLLYGLGSVDQLFPGVNGSLGGSIINTDGTSDGDAKRSIPYPIPARPVISPGVSTLSGTP
jgi:hypothetical protein